MSIACYTTTILQVSSHLLRNAVGGYEASVSVSGFGDSGSNPTGVAWSTSYDFARVIDSHLPRPTKSFIRSGLTNWHQPMLGG